MRDFAIAFSVVNGFLIAFCGFILMLALLLTMRIRAFKHERVFLSLSCFVTSLGCYMMSSIGAVMQHSEVIAILVITGAIFLICGTYLATKEAFFTPPREDS